MYRAVLILLINVLFTWAFNVDLKHPIIYSESANTMFGYTVALSKSNDRFVLFAGAPTANSTHDSVFQPGVVFVCLIGNSRCQEINLNYQQGNEILGKNFDYTELRSDSWLGVALDVSPDESQFVACGHLWKDQKYTDDYLTNGICYVSSTNLGLRSIRRLLPLVKRGKQVIERRYVYALGLAGMSAHYAADQTSLLVGAPGVFQMSGTVVNVPNYEKLTSSVTRPEYRIPIPNDERSEDAYFGYAVTSGKFFDKGKVYYAAGAPRQGIYGMAYIYLYDEDLDSEVKIIATVEGTQMGEYFGAALCATDLNNDGITDLIVGAPLHSSFEEEGRVYIFMSDGKHLRVTRDILMGSSYFKARFGTSVASLGDLNLDGFQDIAVGAPYEGNGAVYIYHGSSLGLKTRAAQKIMASDVNPTLKGFGMSVSRGRDIDGNFYPDVAVGSALSSSAVILRSKPVAQISGRLNFDTNHINTDSKNCTVSGVAITCFGLKICVSYDGKHTPDQLDLQVFVDIDTLKKDFQVPRANYLENGQMKSRFNFRVSLVKLEEKCVDFAIYAKDDIVDFLTPVRFDMSFGINEDQSMVEFCKTCPVVDRSSSTNITKQLSFFTGCGEDDRCVSDLHLRARISKYESGGVMVIGSENNLQLLVDVSNDKEPAFQTTLRIVFPPDVDYSRVPGECSPYAESSLLALSCNLGNPLESGRTISLNIGVDLQRLTSAAKELVFNLSLSTASEEESTLDDNSALLVLPVRAVADISVSGWQMFEQQFVFNRSDPGLALITHMYQVTKLEPSPIQAISLELKFPISTANMLTFLRKFSIEVFYNNRQVSSLCKAVAREPSSTGVTRHAETDHGTATIVDCGQMTCHIVNCTLGPFTKRETAMVNITALVDLPVLINATNGADIFQLRSSSLVKILDGSLPSTAPIYSEVSTTFLPRDLVPQQNQIAWWIIILAIIGGILLLAVIIFIFYKLGFFRRKEHERLLDEAAKDNADTNDNVSRGGEHEVLHARADSPEE